MKLTGWTVAEIDATPAVTIDWLLAIHGAEVEAANERRRKADQDAAGRR